MLVFRIAISRVARSTSVPANGSYRANVDPKSPRIRAACGCFSRGNPPRRRSGNRSSPTSCCAWKRRCTAAPAPRCATFVSFPFARRFFRDEKRRFSFNSVVSPVFFIARAFSSDFFLRDAKKPCLRLPRGANAPEARATPRSRDARRRTRPRPASSGDAVGGSARRSRDVAANATRTNRLFVYAPPKPSTRASKKTLFTKRAKSATRRFRALSRVSYASIANARVRFTRTYAHPLFVPRDFRANENENDDASQEEYCNEATLEARLQAVARIMVARPKGARGSGPGPGGPGAPPSAGRGGNASHTQQAHHAQQQGNPRSAAGTWGGG